MPTAKPQNGRRKHSRVAASGRCWCESGSVTIYAELANLSEGGAFVRTSAPLPAGAVTRLQWELADPDGAVDATAVVVWRRSPASDSVELPSGMGLRFQDLHGESREAIQRFVAARGAGESPASD